MYLALKSVEVHVHAFYLPLAFVDMGSNPTLNALKLCISKK